MIGLKSIKEFVQEQKLRWLSHLKIMNNERGPIKTTHFKLDGSKKDRLNKNVEQDMTARKQQRVDAQDHT